MKDSTEVMPASPYPSKGEVIRFLYSALGIKKKDKELDRFAAKGDYNYRLESRYVDHLEEELTKIVGNHHSSIIVTYIKHLLKTYTELVLRIPLDGITRQKAAGLLVEHFFCSCVSLCAIDLAKRLNNRTILALFLAKDISSVEIFLKTIKSHVPQFSNALSNLDKSQKDKLSRWCKKANDRNSDLPDAEAIPLFAGTLVRYWPTALSEDEREGLHYSISTLLLIAVVIERCKRIAFTESTVDIMASIGYFISSGKPHDYGEELSQAVIEHSKHLVDYAKLNMKIHRQLGQKGISADAKAVFSEIQHARRLAERYDHGTTYFIDWLEGRWNTLSGDFDRGLEFYGRAVKKSLYRAGVNQRVILLEALALAAYCGKRPLLKKVKNQLIAFGLLKAPAYRPDTDLVNKQSRSNHDVVEDWEIKNWAREFDRYFPQDQRFSSFESKKTKFKASIGPLISDCKHIDEQKPDLGSPDRKIIISGKKWPQLAYFSSVNDSQSVKALLGNGASVDEASEEGDTAILCAIQEMDPFDGNSMSQECFDVIARYPHKAETLKIISAKKRLAPMVCAVETGRFEVVKKLIELGGDVNHKSGTLGFSPLIGCICMLDKLRNPERAKQRLLNTPLTVESFDAARRYTNGLVGTDFESFRRLAHSPEFNAMNEFIVDFKINSLLEHTSVESVQNILIELLHRGANPNFSYNLGALKGYRPLMLAAELNDVETIELLLAHGANPAEIDGSGRNAIAVARAWQSNNAVSILSESG